MAMTASTTGSLGMEAALHITHWEVGSAAEPLLLTDNFHIVRCVTGQVSFEYFGSDAVIQRNPSNGGCPDPARTATMQR